MKMAPDATSVDGESFAKALDEGCLYSAPDTTPFQRSLAHIKARAMNVCGTPMADGNFAPYDENSTVNQS